MEAKITSVHPEATIMIAAELKGSGSYRDRTMRNGMSFSNEMFAAFLYFCSNIPVFYQSKSITKGLSSPIFLFQLPLYLFPPPFFFPFSFALEKRQGTEKWKEKGKGNPSSPKKILPSFYLMLKIRRKTLFLR